MPTRIWSVEQQQRVQLGLRTAVQRVGIVVQAVGKALAADQVLAAVKRAAAAHARRAAGR